MSIYTAKDQDGKVININGREKNILLSIYQTLDSIALRPEWEDFWTQTYAVKPPSNFSNNRKLLWISEERRWLYTDMHEVDVCLSNETIEKLLADAICEVRIEQKRRSKLLDALTPHEARKLLELFNCFDWI